LRSYAIACGQWMAASQLAELISDQDANLARGIRVNPWRERTRRTTAVVVHFRWVSQLLCVSFADEVQSNIAKYAGLEMVTRPAVHKLFEWVEAYISRQERLMGGHPAGPEPGLSTDVRLLLDALSMEGGSYSGWSVDALASCLDIEAFPLAKIGGTIAPVAFREASYVVELALFNLARRRLPVDKERSDLFENVVKRSLKEALPPDVEIPFGDVYCPINGTANKGETDFILKDSESTFVGECKAMAAVPTPSTVIHSFTDHVGKAVGQLKLRIAALKGGCTVTAGGKPWSAPVENVYGLAVPLHSYGGAVWNHECLPESGADHPDVAVIPIHQLLIVVRAMRSGADLGAYVRFRQHLFALSFELFDELDILAAFMFLGDRTIDQLIEEAPEHGTKVLRTYGVELEGLISDSMPPSARAWRRRLQRTLT